MLVLELFVYKSLFAHKIVNQILSKLFHWSTYWCRTSQLYINKVCIIYNNNVFCTEVNIDYTIYQKINVIERSIIDNLYKMNAL